MKETQHNQASQKKSKAHEKNGIKKNKERPKNYCHIYLKTSKRAIGIRLHNNYEHILGEITQNKRLGGFFYFKERSKALQQPKAHIKSVA